MRVVFMGTPAFAATILKEVAAQHEVVAVYTRPDAVRGRGNALVPSLVKEVALSLGIPVHTPKTFRDEAEVEILREYNADVLVVAAYGMLLPSSVLACAKHGGINAHASLLPRWRGAAPVERGILAGDDEVGVCAMRVDEALDAGPYCASRSIPVEHRSVEDLLDDLAYLGAEVILSALAQFEAGRVFWVEQDENLVTYADKISKGELNVCASDTSILADRRVRASSDAHPCKLIIGGKTISLLEAKPAALEECPFDSLEVGFVRFAAKRLFLGMADGPLEILRVKPEGKKDMDAKSFAAGVQNIKSGKITWRSLGD